MVSPNSSATRSRMTVRSVFLWGLLGLVAVTTFVTHDVAEAPALTLESGLGPAVETSQL